MSVKNGTVHVDIIPQKHIEPELPETPAEASARLIKFAEVNVVGGRRGKSQLEIQMEIDAQSAEVGRGTGRNR